MVVLLSIEKVTSVYRSLFVNEDDTREDLEQSMVTSARVIGMLSVPTSRVDGDGIKKSFFSLQKQNAQLEAEVQALRRQLDTKMLQLDAHKLADGSVLDVGVRVVAVAPSNWGHYKEGQTGVITGLNPEDSANPVVKWDHR